jgi:hypothetical protein
MGITPPDGWESGPMLRPDLAKAAMTRSAEQIAADAAEANYQRLRARAGICGSNGEIIVVGGDPNSFGR